MSEQGRMRQLLDWALERAVELRAEYIERMAAAYLLKADIDPREVELVEDHQGTEIVFYFRRKAALEPGTEALRQIEGIAGAKCGNCPPMCNNCCFLKDIRAIAEAALSAPQES